MPVGLYLKLKDPDLLRDVLWHPHLVFKELPVDDESPGNRDWVIDKLPSNQLRPSTSFMQLDSRMLSRRRPNQPPPSSLNLKFKGNATKLLEKS